jgi:hypothetical protein
MDSNVKYTLHNDKFILLYVKQTRQTGKYYTGCIFISNPDNALNQKTKKSFRHVCRFIMGKIHKEITSDIQAWIEQQKLFFVSTAPLSAEGHINCSPKGLDSFRILGPDAVAYQDLTGSGIETIAHLKENKRIVIMFCAFDGPPKIVRLHGRGKVIASSHPDYEKIASHFEERLGLRAYVHISVTRVSDSCGYSVPVYEFKHDRNVLDKWTENKGEEGLQEYRKLKNVVSIDGLPGLVD